MTRLPILLIVLASVPALAADLDNSKAGFQDLQRGDGPGFFDHALVDAQAGLPEAQVLVAEAYQRGMFGVPVNLPEGIKWYEKAAEQHQKDAETALALIYGNGNGVPKDPGGRKPVAGPRHGGRQRHRGRLPRRLVPDGAGGSRRMPRWR